MSKEQKILHYRSVNPSTGCWEWMAAIKDGYGSIYAGHRYRLAHQVSYEVFVGPIPEGLQLDHLCRNRACVNPAHLEPVTLTENQRRSPLTFAGKWGPRKYCPKGHPLKPRGKWRACPVCVTEYTRQYSQKYRSEHKQEFNEYRREWRKRRRANGEG